MWAAAGAEVVAEAGARLRTYEKEGHVVTGFLEQFASIPRGSRVLFIGGWNDHPPWDSARLAGWQHQMVADLEELAELAAARRLRVVRAYLPEPEAAEETQLLEGLYSRVVPWSVLTDWPGFYRELKPLEYWECPSWRTTWGWKVDCNHRLWTPAAAARLVSWGAAALDAAGPAGRGA